MFLETEVPDREESDEEGLSFVERGSDRLVSRRQPRRGWTSAIFVGVLLLAAAAACFARHTSVGQEPHASRIVRLAIDESCHTAVKGEACYVDVEWARTIGIQGHSDWYEGPCPGLQATSSFEEFQACVYKINQTSCPLPCNPASTDSDDVGSDTDDEEQVSTKPEAPEAAPQEAPCHIAQKGEECYTSVIEAMVSGIRQHPETFPGITKESSFEDFQDALHNDPDLTTCPRPCSCRTAKTGESCYQHVMWAKQTGIAGHPDWYHGLTADSTFEEVQAYLHKDAKGSCELPCQSVDVATVDATSVEEPERDASCLTAEWPDLDHNLVCGKCKVLVNRFSSHYKTCRNYCSALGRSCAGAWEEVDDTCTVLHTMTCDETVASSDAICECGDEAPGSEVEQEPSQEAIEKQIEEQMRKQDEEERNGGKRHVKEHLDPDGEPVCHIAVKGQTCYRDVLFGMQKGVHEHPEWYPGLNQMSSFESFQSVLHGNPELNCPKPCACHSAKRDDKCLKNVQWVIREGIEQHPSWYHGLSVRSRFDEVQQRLHEDEHTTCGSPCTGREWGSPSLFCFSVFRSQGYELELVKAQLDKNVGIFGCDDFSVLSDKRLPLLRGMETLMIPPCEKVGVSKDGTAANTLIFMQAWGVIWDDARWRAHDWVIKADPDAVVLPERLRSHLKPHTGKNVFVKNCMKYVGPGWPMMFGSLEAFTHEAMESYFKGAEKCKDSLQWQAWGEDLYMGNCLNMLGASSVFDGGLIGDNVCKGANCADGTTAAYHPFKSAEAWFQCYNQAMSR